MTIRFELRTTKKFAEGEKSPLHISISDGRDFRKRQVTQIKVNPAAWDSKLGCLKKRYLMNEEERIAISSEMSNMTKYVSTAYVEAKQDGKINDSWLMRTVNDYYSGKSLKEPKVPKVMFDDIYDKFLETRNLSVGRRRHYEVLRRMIHRYVSYVRCAQYGKSKYEFNLAKVTTGVLDDLYDYIEHENEYVEQYPKILEEHPEAREIKPRGENYMSSVFKELKALFNWSYKTKLIKDHPFDDFEMPTEQYGDPIYLTMDDVGAIAYADFSDDKSLEEQRDIFVFQCIMGCRVGDLMRLTKADVVNGVLEYIPDKTIRTRTKTIKVPLNDYALEIVKRYKDRPGERLLPFISSQNYNENIKVILKKAGVTYLVTKLDPITRRPVKVPINTIASSHIARRTFVGNLYKGIKDPAIISSLTGHAEYSRSFSRYRNIDMDVKRETVDLLDFSKRKK